MDENTATNSHFYHNATEKMENATVDNFDKNSSVIQPNFVLPDESTLRILRTISMILDPVIIAFGTFGNVLSLIVMRRGSLRNVSTCFYMSVLAVADTGILWTSVFYSWTLQISHLKFNINSWNGCKLGPFLHFLFQYLSSGILVAMSIEKFIALYFPLKAKSICTVKTAKRVSLAITMMYAAFSSQFIYFSEKIVVTEEIVVCVFENIPSGYFNVYASMDSVLYSFGPFTIMLFTNFAIILKFVVAKWRSKRNGLESTSQALSKNANKGVAMLVTVSVMFIVLTGPISVLQTVTQTPNYVLVSLLTLMAYFNNAINCVLYSIVGSRFRKELKKTLCCCRPNSMKRGNARHCEEGNEMSTSTSELKSRSTVLNDTGSPI